MIIRNARILTFDAENRVIDSGVVEVRPDGVISYVGPKDLPRHAEFGEESFDAEGKLLMPALINCHTHLYSTLARGMALRTKAPGNFIEILKRVWWRLDLALDEEDIYYSALVGLIDSAKSGVGTLIDHHSSPNSCCGSLDLIERAFREVGLRGALCFETTDRNGPEKMQAGIAENVRFIKRVRHSNDTTVAANFGLHASFTLSDRSLRACAEANQDLQAGFHIHVAEDHYDVEQAKSRHNNTPVQRLCDLGILDERALAAHCVHTSASDRSRLASRSVNVIHNPQSNCNNAVGTAKVTDLFKANVLVGLGSDGYSPRIWEEYLATSHLQKLSAGDPRAGAAEAYTAALLNNRAIAKKVWGWDIGRIETGSRADLALYDYYPPTPLTPDSAFGHIHFGITHASVDALIVNGRFVIRNHRSVNVDERAISAKATARARKLWERL